MSETKIPQVQQDDAWKKKNEKKSHEFKGKNAVRMQNNHKPQENKIKCQLISWL